MKKKLYVLAILLLLTACTSSGDTIESRLHRIHEETEPGTTFHAKRNDITVVTVTHEGFLAAGSAGISRWTFENGSFAVKAYTTSEGLPSIRCPLLLVDCTGSVWAACAGGVAYLPKGTDSWECYTKQNGLPSSLINHLALSLAGDRIWVGTRNGLATAKITERRWQVFQRVKKPSEPDSYLNGNDVLEIFPHPYKEIVWCRISMPSECMCGENVLMSELSLKSGKWKNIPGTESCPHVSVHKVQFNKELNLLWLLRGYEPPMVYDYAKKKTRTWPKEPLWEGAVKENGEEGIDYEEWFGGMAPAKDGSGNVWFGTSAGLWLYLPREDKWEPHQYHRSDLCAESILAMNERGNRIAWAREDAIATYDLGTKEWRKLWGEEPRSDAEEKEDSEEELEPIMPLKLVFAPGEEYLWCRCEECIIVSNLKTGESIRLDGKSALGLDSPRLLVFDKKRGRAIVATPEGIVVSDYAGKTLRLLKEENCPRTGEVARFVFAPDGSEVWCLLKTSIGSTDRAAVYDTKKGKWSRFPSTEMGWALGGIVFSCDGKTAWASVGSEVYERTKDKDAWMPIKAKTGCYSLIEEVYLSPRGDELWLNEHSSGLLRVKLKTDKVSQYVKTDLYRHDDVKRQFALVGDYIESLVFARDGKYAIAVKDGLSIIDLASGEPSNHPAEETIRKILISPDDRTAWCVFSSELLWSFDIEKRKWGHKFSSRENMPLSFFRSVALTPDGSHLWIRGRKGVAVYSFSEDKWKSFAGKDWEQAETDSARVVISPDGKYAVTGHTRGIAVLSADGKTTKVLSPKEAISGCEVAQIVPVLGSADFICGIWHPDAGGIYRLNMKTMKLVEIKKLRATWVSAMGIDPRGHLWVAIPGGIVEIPLK